MSKSIMIEVDETTKSILELLEQKITNGVNTTFQSFKLENNSALQGLYSQIHIQIQELGKSLTKENERVGRKLDDLLNDLEDQLDGLKNHLSDVKNGQVEAIQQSLDSMKAVQNEWNTSFAAIRNELVVESQKQTELISHSTMKMEQKWEALHTIISKNLSQQQEAISKLADKQSLVELEERVADKQSLVGLEENLTERLNSELNRMESNLNVKADVQLLVKKLEQIEKELIWANQPFYKKRLGRRGSR